MPTKLAKILKRIDEELELKDKVAYLFSYPQYRKEILAHILKEDSYELPA